MINSTKIESIFHFTMRLVSVFVSKDVGTVRVCIVCECQTELYL